MLYLYFVALQGCATEDTKPVTEVEEPTLVCADPFNNIPQSGVWSPRENEMVAIETTFMVDIDVDHDDFSEEGFHSREQAVTITNVEAGWEIVGAAKHMRAYPDLIRLDLYISPLASGIQDAVLNIDETSSSTIRDYRVDPWAQPTDETEFDLATINQEGYGHISLGLEKTDDLTLTFTLSGTESFSQAQNSSPIALSHDDTIVWSVFADTLNAVDVSTNETTPFSVPGTPKSVAVTPDDKYALTVSSQCNQLHVVDTDTMEVVQIFSEEDGIGREPRNLVLSPNGQYVYISSYVGDTVSVFERREQGFQFVDDVAVGRRPTGVSISPDGDWLYVAHYLPRGPIRTNHGWMSVINTQTMEIENEVEFVDQFNLEGAACVREIPIFSTWEPEDLSFEGVPKLLSGVFMHPNGNYALLPGLKSPGFPALEGDLSSWGVTQTRKGANNPAVLYPVTFTHSPLGETLPWQMAQDVIDTTEDFLRCAKPTNDIEFVTPREASVLNEDRDELYFYPGTITPGAQTPFMPMGAIHSLEYTRGGRRALALSYVADMIAVLDGATMQPASLNHFTLSGSNPVGMAMTADGTRGFVAYENSPFVSIIDTEGYAQTELPKPMFTPYWLQDTSQVAVSLATRQTLTRDITTIDDNPLLSEIGQLNLGEDPMDEVMRRGKILFSSSNPEKYPGLSGHPHASCFSCHPDGASDGSAWGTVEGERRTNSLRGGTAGRGWLHYSATHADITTFLDIVLPERLGGEGLNEEDMHALSNYIAYGIPKIQNPKTDPELVAIGKEIFDTNCVSCHMGETYSSGNPEPNEKYGGSSHDTEPYMYDIGTGTDRAGVILGAPFAAIFPEPAGSLLRLLNGDRDLGEGDIVEDILAFEPRPNRPAGLFKAPSLTNIWDESLLLHDGSYTNLTDLIQYKNTFFSFSLTEEEQQALIEYLRTL